MISTDQAHVLLDAVELFDRAVRAGTASPWRDYDGDSTDPKTSRVQYLFTVGQAKTNLAEIVGGKPTPPGMRRVVVEVEVLVDVDAYRADYGDVADLDEYTAATVRGAAQAQLDRLAWGRVEVPE
ncbi:MAG: hypothetical protein ABWZ30_01030 [Jiangellaceae bacterium]